tara:strand:- start:2710 stop:3549 length:840 start_codon:yes stop_codon:yes gene_type:complete
MNKKSYFIKSKDGSNLMYYSWLPNKKIKVAIGIIHGLGEHSSRYDDFAEYFCKKGYGVYSIDLRGHGKSEGKRGHVNNFKKLIDDSEEMFINIRKENLNVPMVMFGHSLGGCIALNYLCENQSKEIDLAIISSPWLKTVLEPPKFIIYIQKILVVLFPSFTLNNRLDPYHLSKNTNKVKKYIKDPLVHNRISLKMFSEVNKAIDKIENESEKINIPVLLLHGKKDNIISFKGTKKISKKINNSKLILYEGLYHEPHNDLEKNEILDNYTSFIKNNIDLK